MSVRTAGNQAEELTSLIRHITESDAFRMAPMMRALLLYLWEHRGESVSEYAIAVEALGRSADFDPRADSTVRVQMARLRAKLRDFYESAGDEFPLRLSIPLGTHELQYEYRADPGPASSGGLSTRHATIGAVILLLVVSCACVLLIIENRRLRSAAPPQLPSLWRNFLGSGHPTLIVVPSPLLFHWPEQQIYLRDLAVSAFNDRQNSAAVRELTGRWGEPELAQTYVGAMEMTAGVRLLQYLDERRQDSQMVESRRFSTESFGRYNTIFLGMPRTTTGYLDRLLGRTNFYLASVSPDVVRSRSPQPGEAQEYREVAYSADRRTIPAILAFLPARPEGPRSMILLGRNLLGVTSILLSPEGLAQLEREVSSHQSPDAWEMVIEAEINRDAVIRARPVAFRSISPEFWTSHQ